MSRVPVRRDPSVLRCENAIRDTMPHTQEPRMDHPDPAPPAASQWHTSAVAIIEPSLLTMGCPLERGGRLALPASGSAHLAPCHLGTVCKG